ncbi:MAG: hypothetical protein KC502_05960 [Myxococcales bacterium]|nr:hypothetical protein [Myxococcales bacterium]
MITRFMIAICLLAACGCGTDGQIGGNKGPEDGKWVGDDLSFSLTNAQLSQLVVHKATCTGEDGCTQTYGTTLAGPWPALPTINITADDYAITGEFSGRLLASGTVVMGVNDPCCKVVGVWTAEFDAPHGGNGNTGNTDGGATGSIDWNGASTGDLHPGPAHSVPPSTGSDKLSAVQQAAHVALLDVRAAVGAGPIVQDAALAQAAQAHAEFYVTHHAKYQAKGLNPHAEDASFGAGFTGTSLGQRVAAAGFSGPPGAEVMAFTGSATGAVDGWMATVYHRLPLIAPPSERFGYGGAVKGGAKAEVMDFSARSARKDDPVVVYPYPGQAQVPKSWSGNEGPQPPPPPGGYPSGPVITARVPGAVSWGAHTLTYGDGKAVEHVFLTSENDPNMKKFDRFSVAMYSNAPLQGGVVYTVTLKVTVDKDEQTLSWTFTTQ